MNCVSEYFRFWSCLLYTSVWNSVKLCGSDVLLVLLVVLVMLCCLSVSYTHLDVYKRQVLLKGILYPVTGKMVNINHVFS